MPSPVAICDSIRSSCQVVTNAHKAHITLDTAAAAAYAGQLDVETVRACVRPPTFPIRFDDQKSEITFLALYHILQFGSGYDEVLLARNKRDAKETMQFGALGMVLSAKRLDAKWMQAFTNYSVHNFFGIESHDDAPVPNLPGVTMSRPGPLAPLVTSIVSVVQETGQALESEGDASLGDLILRLVEQLHQSRHPRPAAALVAELCDTLPAFADSVLYDGQKLVFARKAQALVSDLAARWGPEDGRFAFADVDQLTADSGSVVPAALRALGVIHLSEELAATVDSGQELAQGPHERAMRAAAVTGVDAIAAAAGGLVTARQLSAFLTTTTESDAAFRARLKCHATRGVTAY